MEKLQGVIKLPSTGILINGPHFGPCLRLLLFGRRQIDGSSVDSLLKPMSLNHSSMASPSVEGGISLLCLVCFTTVFSSHLGTWRFLKEQRIDRSPNNDLIPFSYELA